MHIFLLKLILYFIPFLFYCILFIFAYILLNLGSVQNRRRCPLTGEGELGQGDVTVQTVVDEADADALRLDLHAGQRRRVAGRLRVALAGPAAARHDVRLGVLQQPGGRLVQLACGGGREPETRQSAQGCSIMVKGIIITMWRCGGVWPAGGAPGLLG